MRQSLFIGGARRAANNRRHRGMGDGEHSGHLLLEALALERPGARNPYIVEDDRALVHVPLAKFGRSFSARNSGRGQRDQKEALSSLRRFNRRGTQCVGRDSSIGHPGSLLSLDHIVVPVWSRHQLGTRGWIAKL